MRAFRRLSTLAAAVSTAVLVPAFAVEGDERVAPQLEPTASLPAVEAPSVPDAPAVSVPDVPAVQTPDTPAAPVPDTPAVQTPDVPATSTPDVPGVQAPSAGGVGGESSRGAESGSSASGSSGSEAGGGDASGGKGYAAKRTTPAEQRRGTARRRAARERRFRASVESLRGCFGSLSEGEREVLTLRAGLDGESPRSAAQVAEQLGVSNGRVRSTERRALRRLKRANRSTGCGGSVGGTQSIGDRNGVRLVQAQLPRLQSTAMLAGPEALVPTAELADRNEVRGARASS
jgi:DNA-binding CsgD family transcriptional regulator